MFPVSGDLGWEETLLSGDLSLPYCFVSCLAALPVPATYTPRAYTGQKGTSHSLEMELEIAVTCRVAQEIKPRSSRTGCL